MPKRIAVACNDDELSFDEKRIATVSTDELFQSQSQIITQTLDQPASHNTERQKIVLFQDIAATYDQIKEMKGTNSKNAQVELLGKMFGNLLTEETTQLIKVFLFSIMKLGPDYEVWDLGLGKEALMKVIMSISGRTMKNLRDEMQKLGDLGTVAAMSKSTQTVLGAFMKSNKIPQQLSMNDLFSTLQEIAQTKGQNSSAQKENLLRKLLQTAQPNEIVYIVRFIEKNLKIGSAEKTMLSGLVKALYNNSGCSRNGITLDQYSEYFNQSISEYPNYAEVIIQTINLGVNINKLNDICKVTSGVPCKPMLAKPTKSIGNILSRLEGKTFTCEFKYDGFRAQIHYNGQDISVFSRNLENATEAYPDVTQSLKDLIQKQKDLHSFILDSEIVAFDKTSDRILNFQTLTTRARKNISSDDVQVRVCVFLFDILYLNGQSLLGKQLIERRQVLRDNFPEMIGICQLVEAQDTDDIEEIQQLFQKSIKTGCEGLMIKTLEENATYEPAKRSFRWLKLKKDYIDSALSDSFDLVPIAAFYGKGKRCGFYGAYLLACYNPDFERYETTCKVGTGFSDTQLENFHSQLSKHLISAPLDEYYLGDYKADVWIEPVVVWEIKGADIQISPIYTAASGDVDTDRGLGIRFPRILRVRDDKAPMEATTSQQLAEIYREQACVQDNDLQDDFY